MSTDLRRGPCALAITALLVASAFASGCGNTRVALPDGRELSAVAAGRKAIVLLRGVAQTRKGAERTAFGPDARGKSQELCKADLDGYGGFGSPRRGDFWSAGTLRSPTASTLRDGWVYFLVRPGTYYLSADMEWSTPAPPVAAHAEASPAEARASGWLLEVPGGAPLVYAGTLVFGGGPTSESARLARIRDDSAAASVLASAHFADLTPPRAVIVQPYLGPVERTVAARLSAAGVCEAGSPQLKAFDVHWAVVQDASRFGRAVLYDYRSRGGSTNSAGDLFLVALGCGGTGIGALSGAIGGASVARELQPCVDETTGHAAKFGVPARIVASLKEQLGTGHAGEASPPTLLVEVKHVRLRPCQSSHLACLEVRLRARVWDPQSRRHLMDRVVNYSNKEARYRNPPDGRPLDPHLVAIDEAPALDLRTLARATSDERRRQVDVELERAVRVITETIVRDLRP